MYCLAVALRGYTLDFMRMSAEVLTLSSSACVVLLTPHYSLPRLNDSTKIFLQPPTRLCHVDVAQAAHFDATAMIAMHNLCRREAT